MAIKLLVEHFSWPLNLIYQKFMAIEISIIIQHSLNGHENGFYIF